LAIGAIVLSALFPDETSGTSAVVAKVTATVGRCRHRRVRRTPIRTPPRARKDDSFGVALPDFIAAVLAAVRKSDQQQNPPAGGA
jgi:hypothetical protein